MEETVVNNYLINTIVYLGHFLVYLVQICGAIIFAIYVFLIFYNMYKNIVKGENNNAKKYRNKINNKKRNKNATSQRTVKVENMEIYDEVIDVSVSDGEKFENIDPINQEAEIQKNGEREIDI